MHVWIDGDILVYKAGFSVETRLHCLYYDTGGWGGITYEYSTKKEAMEARESLKKHLSESGDKLDLDTEGRYFVATELIAKLELEEHNKEAHLENRDLHSCRTGLLSPRELEERAKIQSLHRAKHNVNTMLRGILDNLSTSESIYPTFTVVLSSNDRDVNYRYKAAKTLPYKANRGSKPILYNEIRDYLLDRYEAVVSTEGEADDMLGREAKGSDVIVSIDKDLLMLPNRHYNMDTKCLLVASDPGRLWMKTSTSNKKTLKGYGFKWFCAQMLMGDSVDNIPGLYRYGPVKALTILDKCSTIRDMWAAVLKEYRKCKATGRLDEIRQLLWIQRDRPFEEYLKKSNEEGMYD